MQYLVQVKQGLFPVQEIISTMVKKLDWLPLRFYAWITLLSMLFIFAGSGMNDYNKLHPECFKFMRRVVTGTGDEYYSVSGMIQICSVLLFEISVVLTAKRFTNHNKLCYHTFALALEFCVFDLLFSIISNPYAVDYDKWNTYGMAAAVAVIKFIIDGRFNKNSLVNFIKSKRN